MWLGRSVGSVALRVTAANLYLAWLVGADLRAFGVTVGCDNALSGILVASFYFCF